jgi:hypothetical protein
MPTILRQSAPPFPAHAADLFQVVHGSCKHGQAPQAGDGVCQVPLGIVQLHEQQLHVAGSQPTALERAAFLALYGYVSGEAADKLRPCWLRMLCTHAFE